MSLSHRFFIPAAVALIASPLPAANLFEEHFLEGWSYEAIPYIWATGFDGHIGFGQNVHGVDARLQDLIDLYDVGAALRVSARKGPIAWFIEANYLGYEHNGVSTMGSAHVESTQTFGEAGLSYELDPALELYGGVRAQQIDSGIELVSGHSEANQSWVDGILGFRWTPVRSSRWTAWLRADAGGGGSQRVWLAEAGARYQWTSRWGAYVAYRKLATDYHHDEFVYDMRQGGLLFGFGVRF